MSTLRGLQVRPLKTITFISQSIMETSVTEVVQEPKITKNNYLKMQFFSKACKNNKLL